jgi:hypothetical protein
MTARDPEGPPAGAESHAHNLFAHLSAELGVPAALLVAGCLAWWLTVALRRSLSDVDTLAAVALAGTILVHANLEYPLSYLYFLGFLGLVVGHVPVLDRVQPVAAAPRPSLPFLRVAALFALAGSGMAYAHFRHLEDAMQRVVMQVELGAAPQQDAPLLADLAQVPAWSPYRDYAESIFLMTAMPTVDNAADLVQRCDRAIRWAPSPYLLSRCATAYRVAGRADQASALANSVCKIFPASDLVLIQSMSHVERVSPEAGDIPSSCIERRPSAPTAAGDA